MSKKIVAAHRKTGSKYVTVGKPVNGLCKVQTLKAFKTGSYWYISKKDLVAA